MFTPRDPCAIHSCWLIYRLLSCHSFIGCEFALNRRSSPQRHDHTNSPTAACRYQLSQQQCVLTGQLWDSTQITCVSPVPSMMAWATAARMLAAEQDIDGLENALNQENGSHSVCTICPLNREQYPPPPPHTHTHDPTAHQLLSQSPPSTPMHTWHRSLRSACRPTMC
jgi:hypothetical protein